MTFVSVIIPIFRRTEWIGKCLESLSKQNYDGNFEVLVIDDGSPNYNEIKYIVDSVKIKNRIEIKLFRKENAGPAVARNYGVGLAKGEILCFVDDDSIPAEDWLSNIIESFNKNINAGIVNGRTRSFDRKSAIPVLIEEYVYPAKSWATCNIAYRRDIFEKLGGFDESFPDPSWEDNELGLRARWAGYSHVYAENSVVYHPHESSIQEFRQKCLLNGRGAAYFSRKYIRRKPLWGIAVPLIMSRRLPYALSPFSWICKEKSAHYLKFTWSYYSLKGFAGTLAGMINGKNQKS